MSCQICLKISQEKGVWGTEESKSRHLFDLKVVDGKKPTKSTNTKPVLMA